MIFLADNLTVNSANLGAVMCEPAGDTAFGYHYFFQTAAGNHAYYSVIPGLTDACLQRSCSKRCVVLAAPVGDAGAAPDAGRKPRVLGDGLRP